MNYNPKSGFQIGNKSNTGKHWKVKDTSNFGKSKYWLGRKRPNLHTKEGKKRISESQKGEKNHNWIKDRTKLKKHERKDLDTQYQYWGQRVKEKDNFKCRLASSGCSGRLEAHHIFNWIDYPGLRYIINNGITLCAFHHPHGREEEKRMISIFQELLSVSEV